MGGRSAEHAVSLRSARSVAGAIDRDKYDVTLIGITQAGKWIAGPDPLAALSGGDLSTTSDAALLGEPGKRELLAITPEGHGGQLSAITELDVIFPLLHGPYGEDGTVQGLLELSNIPYVGAGVLASAAGMDKAVMKVLFAARGLPVGRWHAFVRPEWERDRGGVLKKIAPLGLPLFVKPANLGSSVGISKVKTEAELVPAIETALDFDRKVIVEAAVPNAREIECSVLGNDDPKTSVPGEIIPSREFYDYEAKYIDAGSETVIPARLDASMVATVQQMATEVFRAVDCSGLARVDFLLSRDTGEIVVNEINTMPGFTTISMYSKMWEASGVAYSALVDRLIQLGIERHQEKQRLKTSAL